MEHHKKTRLAATKIVWLEHFILLKLGHLGMTKLFVLCLLATLATLVDNTTATSLTCTCNDCTGNKCSPNAPHGVCITTAEENTLNGTQSARMHQTCQDTADLCNATVTIALTTDVYWRSRSLCCNTGNECNAASLQAPPANRTANKLVCPSCFARDADPCKAQNMSCSGSETQCIDVSGTIVNGSKTRNFSGKGCASPEASKMKNGTLLVFGNTSYNFTNITTTKAKEAITPPTTTQTTTGITTPMTSLSCKCSGGNDWTNDRCSPKTSEGVCIAMTEENTLNGTQSPITNQTCQDNADFCNASITITLTKDVYWRSNTTCCNRTDCDPTSIKIPPVKTTAKQVVCPSCFAHNASSCMPTNENCSPSETKCIDVAGMIMNGHNSIKFVGKGCATATAKSIKNGTKLVFGNTIYQFTASTLTDGASQTPGTVAFTFLLSSFVVLLQA